MTALIILIYLVGSVVNFISLRRALISNTGEFTFYDRCLGIIASLLLPYLLAVFLWGVWFFVYTD